jgi:uncharacterized membrane protein (DUF106 family)
MIITLIGVTIIGFICFYTYIETDRQEIQKKQEALQKAQDALDARLKEQERLRHEETIKHIGEAEV